MVGWCAPGRISVMSITDAWHLLVNGLARLRLSAGFLLSGPMANGPVGMVGPHGQRAIWTIGRLGLVKKRHATWRRRLALFGGVALLASLATVSTGAAQDEQADTSATVGGGATPPTIECGWALNDVDHNWASAPEMTYGQDDSLASAGSPCVASGNVATMPNPYPVPVISVKPNAHDEPTQAYVELWGAVTSNNLAGLHVYFDVWHPDGTHKVQIDAARYADRNTSARCGGPTGMFTASETTGQLTHQAVLNIQAECVNQQKSLWYAAFGISKHQPYGLYRIDLTAANAGGAAVVQTFYIEVLSFYQLEKDFTSVNFGPVGPNAHFWQPTAGDFIWDGTDNAANQHTSVRNTGNAGIGIDLRFHSLCLTTAPVSPTGCTDDKRIDHFDAKFGTTIASLEALGEGGLALALTSDLASTAKPAPAGPLYSFTDTGTGQTLCPNDVGKIEFSIYTENIQAGTYAASPGIQIIADPNPNCPTDLGGVYDPTPGPGNGYQAAPVTPAVSGYWP
jgi:hypothetical protein